MRHQCDARMENLEGRMLLAGNLTVQLIGPTLHIIGDDRGNDLVIDTIGLGGGQLRLTTENTTINGQFGPIEFSGITGDIQVSLGEGKNRLKIQHTDWQRPLQIGSLSGADYIQLENSRLDQLLLRSRGGEDTINFVNTRVLGEVFVGSGGGDDVVTFAGGRFDQDVLVQTSKGNDTVFHDSNFEGSRRIVDGAGKDRVTDQAIEEVFDFRNGEQGWRGAFADVFRRPTESQELDWRLRRLPSGIGSGTGMFITSNNSTDDVFMYLTKTLSLEPATVYQIRYDIRFASNAPINCGGIGGQPGESVFLKAGATNIRPRARVDEEGIKRLNVDHGQQAQSGKAASVIGHIGNGQDCPANPTYVSLRRRHVHTALVRTDLEGRLHLIVGTDSGFEGKTSLYYQRIGVRLIEVAPSAR